MPTDRDGGFLDQTVTLIRCPQCELMMSRTKTVECSDSWTEWQCWDCGHSFGGFCDGGHLDLGLTPNHTPNHTPGGNS